MNRARRCLTSAVKHRVYAWVKSDKLNLDEILDESSTTEECTKQINFRLRPTVIVHWVHTLVWRYANENSSIKLARWKFASSPQHCIEYTKPFQCTCHQTIALVVRWRYGNRRPSSDWKIDLDLITISHCAAASWFHLLQKRAT